MVKKITLCNIYAPNDQPNQLQFIQELNNCIIDKTELTSLIIVGGDWNCTLTKKDKMGGAPWKSTVYSNLISTTMEMFDLVDIQRVRHPKLRKFTCVKSFEFKIQNRLFPNTVEPRLTATSLIRPPRYYGHFILSRQNIHTFSFNKTPFMRPPR